MLAIFRQEIKNQIVGVRVTDGILRAGVHARVSRNGEVVGDGLVESVRSGKEIIREAASGTECGIGLIRAPLVAAGDTFEFYQEEEQRRSVK